MRERLGARFGPALAALGARYAKLEPREKLLVRVGAVATALFLAYNLLYRPVIGLRDGLQDRADSRQRELVVVRGLARNYQRLKLHLAATEKRTVPGAKDFSLFSVLEQTLARSVGRDKIGSMTPSDKRISNQLTEHSVDLKLAGVNLAQIVDALYGVQALPVPVTVSSLHIKRSAQDSHSYDVDMTCVTLSRNG